MLASLLLRKQFENFSNPPKTFFKLCGFFSFCFEAYENRKSSDWSESHNPTETQHYHVAIFKKKMRNNKSLDLGKTCVMRRWFGKESRTKEKENKKFVLGFCNIFCVLSLVVRRRRRRCLNDKRVILSHFIIFLELMNQLWV